MYPDVTQMNEFYRSALGQHCESVMSERLNTHWPKLAGLKVGGFGYTLPQLSGLLPRANVSACVMPAPMGISAWPKDAPNKATLSEEDHLPFEDQSLDRLVLCHALEHVDAPRQFLREIWRVTAAEGRVIMFVPNRRSLWALSDRTPFGHGCPFSRGQLSLLLNDSLFEVTHWSGVFYGVPGTSSFSVGVSRTLEPWGQRLWKNLPGLWMVEAKKRLVTPLTEGKTIKQRAYAAAGLSPSH